MSIATPKPSSLRTPVSVVVGILAVSTFASALICWLVYYHAPTDVAGTHLRSLPLVNAVLNSLATLAIITGYVEIRQRRVLQHRASMFFAFFFSSIFLASYLVNFALHGETKFNRLNPWWPFYWRLLASHIVLSVIALPLILITFFLSLSGRFPVHRKVARWTLPIWLYVSVTGVVVYIMQAACR
jgi:putative membrane protein